MEEQKEEPVDPRVQIELERLNASSDDINKLENKLEEANSLFRSTLRDSTASLKLLSRRLGSAVEKARPFYEAREMARRTQLDCHRAALQFQRASVLHQNARETIQMAEERFLPRRSGSGSGPGPGPGSGSGPGPGSGSPPQRQFEFDSAWQEMLNHATMKLLEAEHLKHSSETEHLRRANTFSEAQKKLKRLEKSLERPVARARPYFEQREVVQQELVRQKAVIQQLQRAVSSAKARYSSSLRELESISEQIHQQRRLRELEPDLVPVDLDTCELDSVSAAESATSDYQEDFRLSQEQQYWAEMREQIEAMSAGLAGSREPEPPATLQPEPEAAEQQEAKQGQEQEQQEAELPLAEELNAARLIARRRRTVSEAAGGAGGGDPRVAAERRLSLAVDAEQAAAADQQQWTSGLNKAQLGGGKEQGQLEEVQLEEVQLEEVQLEEVQLEEVQLGGRVEREETETPTVKGEADEGAGPQEN